MARGKGGTTAPQQTLETPSLPRPRVVGKGRRAARTSLLLGGTSLKPLHLAGAEEGTGCSRPTQAGTSHPPPFSVSKLAPTFPQGPAEGGWDRQQGLHDLFPARPRPCGPGSGCFPTLPSTALPGVGLLGRPGGACVGISSQALRGAHASPTPQALEGGSGSGDPSGVGVPSRGRLGQLRNGARLSWILNPEPVTGGKGPGRSTEKRVRDGADGDPGGRAPNRQWGGPGSPLTGSRGPAVGRLHARRARLPAARPASDGGGRTPPTGGEPRPRGAGRRAPGGGTTSAALARGEGGLVSGWKRAAGRGQGLHP